MLAFILSPVGRWVATIIAIAAIAVAIYGKGRNDAAASVQIKDLTNAAEIDRKANAARDAANHGGLPEDDWFRRD